MGEIADDMITGRCCALCGQYFISDDVIDKSEYEIMSGKDLYEHGYSVACSDCWDKDCGYELANKKTI